MVSPSRVRLLMKTALAMACMLAAHGAQAEQPVSFTEALQQAARRSHQLDADGHASVAAREMAVAAGQRPDPMLTAGIDNLPVSGNDRFSLGNDFMTMRKVGISQELTRADKLQWRSARQEREADKALAQKDLTLASLQRDTAIAWLNVYYTRQMAAALDSQTTLARQEISAAEAAYRGGRGSSADVLAAKSALLALEDRGSQLAGNVETAKNALQRWTGASGDVADAGMPDVNTLRLDTSALSTTLAQQPQIAVLNRQQDIAQADAKLAQANQHPDWSVEVAFQQRGSAYSNMVSVNLSLPLQWDKKNRQNRELASKLATVEQVKDERDEQLREQVSRTQGLLIAWKNGRERGQRYETLIVPAAEERATAVLAAYRGGKAALADVLAARRNIADVRLQSLQLNMETAQLWAQLDFLFPDTNLARQESK